MNIDFSSGSNRGWIDEVLAGDFDAVPDPFSWAESADFAHLMNGYALTGNWDTLFRLHHRAMSAVRSGQLHAITALDAWLALFVAHRGYRHSGYPPPPEAEQELDVLCQHLRAALLHLRPKERAGILGSLSTDLLANS